MKLRKKETGEIGYFCFANWNDPVLIIMDKDGVQLAKYNSLAEMNAEWEDAPEEPKEDGLDNIIALVEAYSSNDSERYPKEIVEKLKAWHKLMDYWGTEVLGWEIRDMPTGGNWQTVNVKFNVKTKKEPMELLDIVFGGEE